MKEPEKSPRRSGGLVWAALLTAVAAHALFWLPLGYREPEPEPEGQQSADHHPCLLTRHAFSDDDARRFSLWMERHDPGNFLRSEAPGGFSALLPPETTAALPQEGKRPVAVPPRFRAAPPAAVAEPRRERTPLLLPDSAARLLPAVGTGRPRLFRADGSEFAPAATAAWVLPDYTGAPRVTVLAVGGADSCRRVELFRSSGVAALDRLALAEATRALAAFADGEVLAVSWPERAAKEKGATAP